MIRKEQNMKEILLYNFVENERYRQIRRYLNKSHIELHIVRAPEFSKPLGALFQLPGFPDQSVFLPGENFREEMIVMKDFSPQELDDFLAFFHKNSLAPVELKAVLTPVTIHWNSIQLYKELKKEQKALNRKK